MDAFYEFDLGDGLPPIKLDVAAWTALRAYADARKKAGPCGKGWMGSHPNCERSSRKRSPKRASSPSRPSSTGQPDPQSAPILKKGDPAKLQELLTAGQQFAPAEVKKLDEIFDSKKIRELIAAKDAAIRDAISAHPGSTEKDFRFDERQGRTAAADRIRQARRDIAEGQKEAILKAEKPMQRIREKLLKTGMPEEEAIDLMDSMTALNEINDDEIEVMGSAIPEFLRITGGRGGSVQEFGKISDRAYAEESKRYIDIGGYITKNIIFHEMGHFAEFEDKDLASAGRAFIASRSTGAPQRLNVLSVEEYDDNEWAVPGRFLSPYVGKIYQDGATEVFSMGLERMTDPAAMARFYQEDREHFLLTLGAIRN